MKIIVGLGNPGKKYQNTRHNVGFALVDFIHKKFSAKNNFSEWRKSKKFQAEISEGTLNAEKIILAKPQTFMNESGLSVQALSSYYKLPSNDLIVLHDDMDIDLGECKIQTNRGSAGHNGVKSIIERLGTQDFMRIRIGIGRDKESEVVDFVLNKFNAQEKSRIKEVTNKIMIELEKLL